MLHLLLHLAGQPSPLPSDRLATFLSTNAAVIRRLTAGLREAGLLRAEKGPGGGLSLARPLEEISLLDVHLALGDGAIFALSHRNAAPDCLLERAANGALDAAMAEAEAVLRARLAAVSLADLARDALAMAPAEARAQGMAAFANHETHGTPAAPRSRKGDPS